MTATMVGLAAPDHVEELFAVLYSGGATEKVAALKELAKDGERGAEEYGTAQRAAELLFDYDLGVQTAATSALGNMGYMATPYAREVATMLNSDDKEVKQAALQSLGYIGGDDQVAAVEACLDHQDLDLVVDACYALGHLGSKASGSTQKLKDKLKDSDASVVAAAAAGLCMMNAEMQSISDFLGKKETRVKVAILKALLEKEPISLETLASPIAKLVGDSDSEVRISAAKLIGILGEKAAKEAPAIAALGSSSDVGVKACVATALAGIGEKARAQAKSLANLLGDESEDKSTLLLSTAGVQPKVEAKFRKPACAVALALGATKANDEAANVSRCMTSKDFELRIASVQAIASMGAEGAAFTDEVMKLVEDPNPQVIAAACLALGTIAENTSPSSAAAEKLADCLKDKLPIVRTAACRGLAKMGDEATNYLDVLVKRLDDQIWSVRAAACEGVTGCGEMGQMYASDICRKVFDPFTLVRVTAIECLAKMGDRGAAFAEDISVLSDDPVPAVRDACQKALTQFGGQSALGY